MTDEIITIIGVALLEIFFVPLMIIFIIKVFRKIYRAL